MPRKIKKNAEKLFNCASMIISTTEASQLAAYKM
jgi:hypothetical protein